MFVCGGFQGVTRSRLYLAMLSPLSSVQDVLQFFANQLGAEQGLQKVIIVVNSYIMIIKRSFVEFDN
jgi:hypothetical protein